MFFLFTFSSTAFAFDLNVEMKDYPSMLGVNQPTVICRCPQLNGLVSQSRCGAPLSKKGERIEPFFFLSPELVAKKLPQYKNGHNKCSKAGKTFNGIDCVRITDKNFAEFEQDLHNITMESSNVRNSLKNKFFSTKKLDKKIGICPVSYNSMNYSIDSLSKGWVARVYLYLNDMYPSFKILSSSQKNNFEEASSLFPPSKQECEINEKINNKQINQNRLTQKICQERNKK